MHIPQPVAAAIALSDRVHGSLLEAFSTVGPDDLDDADPRQVVTVEACFLSIQHSEALRRLMELGLASSALAMLRMQYEALLRATWLLYAANERQVRSLSAPLTVGTAKAAGDSPMAAILLKQIEATDAPGPLKRGLREFRETAWEATNSYVHAGLHPLRRSAGGHPDQELVTAIQSSNSMAYASMMLAATAVDRLDVMEDLNVVMVSHPGFAQRMPR